ncbi:hypothetical protein [Dactylosporangium sp. NPDC049140]|uniref:hypothetical protein n=1 Tax=Dactylosporangium sp. NPDC049140 TaxID=3155647 RepID=UPI0033F0FA6F
MERRTLLLSLLWDVALPGAVYYAARAAGLDLLPALAAGGGAALARVTWVAVTRRRIDGLAAVLLLGSCLLGRPLLYTAARRLAPGLEERWHTDPRFRRRGPPPEPARHSTMDGGGGVWWGPGLPPWCTGPRGAGARQGNRKA